MSLRQPVENEILIRLTEKGFVETIRGFGRESSFFYDVTESAPSDDAEHDERVLAPVPVKRNANRRTESES